MLHGKRVGYIYEVETFGSKDPSLVVSDVYDIEGPPENHVYEVNDVEYVHPLGWPEAIYLEDGTILQKELHRPTKGEPYATYYVETWGDLDPSLPFSEVYEGEFEE